MTSETRKSPVSYRFQVNRLPKTGAEISIRADEEQRIELAREHDLESVERFVADLTVQGWKADGVIVKGRVRADFTQLCVVTLEPIAQKINEEISTVFIPETSRLARLGDEHEIVLDPDADDLPESFTGDSVDLGALAEEFFALGIEPYPRKEGVMLNEGSEEQEVAEGSGPLYEELKKLRGKS